MPNDFGKTWLPRITQSVSWGISYTKRIIKQIKFDKTNASHYSKLIDCSKYTNCLLTSSWISLTATNSKEYLRDIANKLIILVQKQFCFVCRHDQSASFLKLSINHSWVMA